MTTLCQCPAGFEDVLEKKIADDGLSTIYKESGLLVVKGDVREIKPTALLCISNGFALLHRSRSGSNLSYSIQLLSQNKSVSEAIRRSVPPRARSFRIFVQDSGKLVSLGKDMAPFISFIERSSRLVFRPSHADVEYWLIRRASGEAFLARRLSKRAKTEKTLQKGELRPELANLLCLLSEPEPDDIFLDPFCGTGSIPLARSNWPYNMIFSTDASGDKIKDLKQQVKQREHRRRKGTQHFIAKVADGLHLETFDNGFISKIVTDPPWGLYSEMALPIEDFYSQFIGAAARVLRDEGTMVLLIGNGKVADFVLNRFTPKTFKLSDRIDTLVNGKPASALKLTKIAIAHDHCL